MLFLTMDGWEFPDPPVGPFERVIQESGKKLRRVLARPFRACVGNRSINPGRCPISVNLRPRRYQPRSGVSRGSRERPRNEPQRGERSKSRRVVRNPRIVAANAQGPFLSPRWGWRSSCALAPRLTPWATIFRPSGPVRGAHQLTLRVVEALG